MLGRYIKSQIWVLVCGGLVGPIFLAVYFATGQSVLLKWMFWVGLLITAAVGPTALRNPLVFSRSRTRSRSRAVPGTCTGTGTGGPWQPKTRGWLVSTSLP